MVAPSAGPSRGTTPTPTPTHASGGNDVASSSSSSLLRTGAGQPVQQQASKLNPHSASFSYLQQQQQQSMSPYATFSPPPPMPPPQNRNGMYGAPPPPGPSGYSPYPISSANTGGMGMQPGPSGGNGNGNGSWHMAPPPPRGGSAPGQQQYQAMLHHAQQQQQHQHQHQQMAYYPSHSGMVPPSQNRIPPPAGAHPPPSAAAAGANGILLPLSSNPPPLPHHITAPMAAAGFGGMPMSPPPPPPPPQSAGPLHHHQLAAGPQQHLAHSQHIPHHQQHQPLLPPFSPQMRSLPPSTVAGPRLMPAPSLPVSPATPLPPQTVSPAPTQPSPAPPLGRSGSEAVAAANGGGLGDGPRPAFGDATSPPPADLTSSSTNNAVPSEQPHAGPTRSHGHGIRRRKDHLPAPRDAEALTFATHLKIPREYQGMFGTPPSNSIASPGGSNAGGAAATAGSRSRRSAAGTASPSPSRSRSKAVSSTSAVQATPVPVASTSSAPIPAPAPAAAPPAEPATPVSRPAEAVVEPSAPSASQPSEEPPVPSTPKAAAPLSPELTPAPSLPPTSPRTPAAAVKRSWADLVRPPAGSQPKGVNGVMPISATVGGADLSSASSSAPRAADTLLSLLTRAPSHEHSPHAPTPRGLINNGNLCFANSTLQALVYCGSFWNLMSTVERSTKKNLREAMGPAATSGGHAGAPADKTASERSAVEATIAFLAEFRTDEAPAAAFDPILNRKSASASASASGTTTPKPPYNNNNHHLPSSPSVSTPSQPGPLSPTPIHDALRHNPRFDAMRRGTQEDAEEFLGFFLETLHEEILKLVEAEEEQEAKRKGKGKAVAAAGDEGWEEVGSKGRVATTRTTATKESPITCIFGGKLRSVLRCPGQKDSVTIEPFQRLQLDIQPDHVLSIEDALVQLTTPESLPDFMTSRGVRTQDASKQVFVDALPPVLLLHLKRFLYDEVGGVQKSTKKVAYGTELTIDERIMSAPLRAQVGRDGAKYELFGVVYHHGLQASGGHYTVAVRRGYHSPAWLELDDTHMRSLTADEVAVSTAAPTARRWESVSDSRRRFEDEDGDQKNAYLLLYAKSS